MKRILVILFCFPVLLGFGQKDATSVVTSNFTGQGGIVTLEFYESIRYERSMSDRTFELHPSIKPFLVWDQQQLKNPYYDYAGLNLFTDKPFFADDHSYLRISPRISMEPFAALGEENNVGFNWLGGAAIDGKIKDKFFFNIEGLAGLQQPTAFQKNLIDSIGVMPGFGHRKKVGPNYQYHQLSYHLAYKAADWANIIFGRGKSFIGEGYRSFFLSDFSANVDYLKLDIQVWKLRYQVMYNKMVQGNAYQQSVYPLQNKYATMHYLSLNVTKWWNVGAFEAVVWEGENGAVKRNFDINYLNPIIFYRSVEYGMGSPDNALLGGSSVIKPVKGLTLYGNVMLDEFLFRLVVAPIQKKITSDSTIETGSFRNKQAYQLGIKYHQPFGVKDVSIILESNIARPYIYAHGSEYQSYTNFNQPLAHPLGSNFIEWVAVGVWQPNKWNFGLKALYHRKGYSNLPRPFGEDPMQTLPGFDNTDRLFGNFITQGRREDVANIILDVNYTLVKAWNLRVGGTIQNRFVRTRGATSNTTYLSLGISTAFQNVERGF